MCLEGQAKACSPTDQPVRKLKDSLGVNMTRKTFFTFCLLYTSIYYCCKSFAVLLHDVMVGELIASYVLILLFGLGAAAFRVDRARRGNVCSQDQAKACSPTDQPVRKLKDGLGINMTMKTFFTLHITSCEKYGIM